MHSEGFSFYISGSGGWPVFAWPCFWRPQPSATVCNRPQTFATVRLRPSWAQSCRDDGNSRKNVTFLTCQKLWSCRFAWQAWHFVAFQHVSRRVKKSFSVAGAILLLHFQKMCCNIRGKAQHFGHLRCHFAWQAQHFGRVVCVLSVNRIVSAARSGDKVQIAWPAWHFVTCHENRWKPHTKRRFCSPSRRKLEGKRWFWRCRAYGKSCKDVSFSTC